MSETLVDIPAGRFAMGSEDFYPEEARCARSRSARSGSRPNR